MWVYEHRMMQFWPTWNDTEPIIPGPNRPGEKVTITLGSVPFSKITEIKVTYSIARHRENSEWELHEVVVKGFIGESKNQHTEHVYTGMTDHRNYEDRMIPQWLKDLIARAHPQQELV